MFVTRHTQNIITSIITVTVVVKLIVSIAFIQIRGICSVISDVLLRYLLFAEEYKQEKQIYVRTYTN